MILAQPDLALCPPVQSPSAVACAPAPDPNTVIGRSVGLMEAFRPDDGVLTLAEIHARTQMPKPTAYRLLNQLVGWGFLEREQDGYRLGLRLFELGQRVPQHRTISSRVAPVLRHLHTRTGLTVHLAILDRADVVYLEKLDAPGAPAVASRAGGRLPAHCTAVGKAVLAHASSSSVRAVLTRGLQRHSPRTVVVPRLFLGQLEAVRRSGIARDEEEFALGISCVAAPVLDRHRQPVAAISVTARTHHLRRDQTAQAVRSAAAEATRQLGATASDKAATAACE